MEVTHHILDGDFVVSNRDGIVENRHLVHAVVVDSTGQRLYVLGDPSRMTTVRSAAKPMQAVAAIESGAMETFGFEEADLALMCGSHNSEPRHVERARTMLQKLQVDESDLQCGGHPSVSPAVMRAWIRSGHEPSPVDNACSGNHIGVMATAKASGANIAGYHLLDHPAQKKIQSIMEDVAGSDIKWVMDSCNIYTPAMPLSSLANAYAAFAAAADADASNDSGQTRPRARAMARIYSAMVQYPEHVAGDDRFCTALGQAYAGALVGKGGGDGCYAIAVRSSADTRRLGAQGGIGIALKIEDGNYGIMDATAVEILEQLQIGTREIWQCLEVHHRGVIRNTKGVVTGGLSFPFKLRRVHGNMTVT